MGTGQRSSQRILWPDAWNRKTLEARDWKSQGSSAYSSTYMLFLYMISIAGWLQIAGLLTWWLSAPEACGLRERLVGRDRQGEGELGSGMRAVQTCVQVKRYILIVGGQGSHEFRNSGVLHLTLARHKEVIQCFLLEYGLYTIEKNHHKRYQLQLYDWI